MDIIKRNFFRLMRSGAFNEKEALEPMSAFKWRRLYQMVEAQRVEVAFARGAYNNGYDETLNIPDDLLKVIGQKNKENLMPPASFFAERPELRNLILNRKLKKIYNNERHSIDTSVETLELLTIIINNVNNMLNKGLGMSGIILLGVYLRNKGHRVDFIKLETWLKQLHMQRMAQLQGSILMAVFGFEQDELPFVEKEEPSAHKLTMRAVSNLAKDTAKEWHFRQSSTGFVQNNSAVLRRNLRRSIRYAGYAPLETTSNFVSNFVRSLSEIEE